MGSTRFRAFSVASVSLAAAAFLAACGGGEATPTPSAPTPTRPAPTSPPTTAVVPAATATPVPAPTPTAAPTATPAPASAAPKTGGIVKMRYISDPLWWDTYDQRGQSEASYLSPMLSQLVMVDPTNVGQIVGDLAASFQVSADGTVYTLNVRRGVLWHDGTPFTAKDVAYNVERGRSTKDPLKTTMATRYSLLDKVDAPDDFTVRLTLKQPSASFLSNLAVVVSVMYPAHIPIERFKDTPVGTGPFRFKSFRAGSDILYERSSTYWKKDRAGQPLPYLDGVQYFIVSDSANAAATFRTGRTDLTLSNFDSDWTNGQRDALRRQFPEANFVLSPTNGIDMFVPQKPPYTDARVRQAIHLGFDRQLYNRLALEGLAEPLGGLMLPVSLGGVWGLPKEELAQLPGYRADKKAEDIARAKALLKDAGVDPTSMNLKIVGTTAFFRVPAEGIAAVLKETLGFPSTLEIPSTSADQTKTLIAGNFDLGFNSRSFYQDDPFNLVEPYMSSQGGRNYQKWVNPKIDTLLAEQDRALDATKRRQVIQQLEREVINAATVIPLVMNQGVAVTRPYVKNVTVRVATWIPAFYYRMEDVWLDR